MILNLKEVHHTSFFSQFYSFFIEESLHFGTGTIAAIYTVRTEELKSFCEFVEIQFIRQPKIICCDGLIPFRNFEFLNGLTFEKKKELEYENIEKTISYLRTKNIFINDSIIFDQYVNLKNFLKEQDADFFKRDSSYKMAEFFNHNSNINSCSELLIISQFFFSIPAHNATVERIFSFINVQWSDERNRLSVESIRHIIRVVVNLKNSSCQQFHKYLLQPVNVRLLDKIGSI